MKHIPNLFTLLNLVFGCIAIVCVLQPGQSVAYIDTMGDVLVDLPERIALGGLFIFAAGIVDFLDGFVARLFKASSEMGKQLDSLADVVSFGVAPGIIMYQLLRIGYGTQPNGLDVSLIWLLPALLLPCAAAWRLAKFNVATDQQYSFRGLPTPAAGLFVAALPLIIWYQTLGIQAYFINKYLLYAIIIFLSFMMVSNVPIMAFKFRDFTVANNLPKYILIAVAIIAAVFVQWLAVPITIILYVILSLLFKNKVA